MSLYLKLGENMTKEQLEIMSLFEDCTKEINTLEIYKSINTSYYPVLEKLVKEGYLEYRTDNYLKMTGFGLSKFVNPENFKLKLIKLVKNDLRYLFSIRRHIRSSLLELSFGKELINLIRNDPEFTFHKFSFDKGGKKFSFKDTFNIYGEYDLLIVPNDNSEQVEFVSIAELNTEEENKPTVTLPTLDNFEINPKIKELSDKIAFVSAEDSEKVDGQIKRGPWGIAVAVILGVLFVIYMLATDGGY